MAETDAPNWLNSSFLETALRSGGYGSSVTVTASEIGRATVPGDNFVCDIFRAKLQVTLEGRRSTVSLIVKATPAKEETSKVNVLFGASSLDDFTLMLICHHGYLSLQME
jgi:hypothetical protein